VVAYAAAVLFYQIARFTQHPQMSLAWIIGISSVLLLGARALFYYGRNKGSEHVITAS
jgi:ferrous iron transport protein B